MISTTRKIIATTTLTTSLLSGTLACKDHPGGSVAYHCQAPRVALERLVGPVRTIGLGRHVIVGDEKDWCLFEHQFGQTYVTVRWDNHDVTWDHRW